MKLMLVVATLSLLAVVLTGCGDANIVGPSQTGANCSLMGCSSDNAPVEILDNIVWAD